jgi:hypothetical protein
MNRTNRPAIFFVLISLMMGCSDYNLSRIEPHGEELVADPGGSDPTAVLADPATDSSDSSPFGSLDPGEMPEEYFAVAWHDPSEVAGNCYGPCPGVPRYDIIDITGQVVSSFGSPSQQQFSAQHRSLQAAGPGRFLAVTSGWVQDSSFYEHAWIADGLTGESEIIMQWGWNSTLSLPLIEKEIEIPGLYHPRVMVDPHDEDRFYLLTDNTTMYAHPLLGTLYSINVRDAEAEVLMWEAPEMITSDLVPEWGFGLWDPWFVSTFAQGDETMLTLGLRIPDVEGNVRSVIAAFSPQSGPMEWSMDLGDIYPGGEFVVLPPNGDNPEHAIFHEGSDWCPDPAFVRWDGEQMHTFSGNDSLYCSRIGPVLDEQAETFIYYGYSDDSELEQEQRAFISHRGVDVWEYSRFRDGMALRPIEIHAMVRLERPQQ